MRVSNLRNVGKIPLCKSVAVKLQNTAESFGTFYRVAALLRCRATIQMSPNGGDM